MKTIPIIMIIFVLFSCNAQEKKQQKTTTQKPIGILKDLKIYISSTSFKQKGEKPIFTVIKQESIDFKK